MLEEGTGHAMDCSTDEKDIKMNKPLLRQEEVSEGINVIIDNRWAALFPMESKAQIELLIEAVNRTVRDGNNIADTDG